MEKKLPVIAIDGPSASGKGTIARGLARDLGFAYLETGLLYRYVGKRWLEQITPLPVGLNAMRSGSGEAGGEGGFQTEALTLCPPHPALRATFSLQGEGKLSLDLATDIAQKLAQNFSVELLNDPELRSNAVAEAASVTSAHPPVRAALLELQREFARNPNKFFPSPYRERVDGELASQPGEGLFSRDTPLPPSLRSGTLSLKGRGETIRGTILDGRDIASVVCPDADVKLFVTASPEIRAERRTKELQSLGQPATYEQVLQEVRVRDHRDQTREVAPLMPTAGSIEIDTSNLSAEDAIGTALRVIRRTRLLPDE